MSKKVLKIIGAVALFLAIGIAYLSYINTSLNSSDKVSLMGITIEYNRPSVRGRLIFGPTKEALLPYGVYWRLGANESSTIEFTKDVQFNELPVGAGKYKIYAVPGADFFEISLNKDWDTWGAAEPDYSQDLVKTRVEVAKNPLVELFTMELKQSDDLINLDIYFADVKLQIPIKII
jgi:hypothetical protein|tara:strand:- start:7439 stop:7969 length:531 start_codon:yes stop_codon:yes gene_type:complete